MERNGLYGPSGAKQDRSNANLSKRCPGMREIAALRVGRFLIVRYELFQHMQLAEPAVFGNAQPGAICEGNVLPIEHGPLGGRWPPIWPSPTMPRRRLAPGTRHFAPSAAVLMTDQPRILHWRSFALELNPA